jgi:L-asparagine transporter-like permease
MTSRTDTVVNRKGKIPWYVYLVGGVIYTVLAVMLFEESTLPVLAWICTISAPLGFYYARGAWKQDKRNRDDA